MCRPQCNIFSIGILVWKYWCSVHKWTQEIHINRTSCIHQWTELCDATNLLLHQWKKENSKFEKYQWTYPCLIKYFPFRRQSLFLAYEGRNITSNTSFWNLSENQFLVFGFFGFGFFFFQNLATFFLWMSWIKYAFCEGGAGTQVLRWVSKHLFTELHTCLSWNKRIVNYFFQINSNSTGRVVHASHSQHIPLSTPKESTAKPWYWRWDSLLVLF